MSIRLNENFNNSTPFLIGYKQLKIPIVDNDGNPAWPEMFPLEIIHEIQNIVGPRHFSAQMMLDYVDEERVHLDPGALKFYDDDYDNRLSKIGEHIISGAALYWDPSSGRTSSDGSVCVLIYRDDKNRIAFIHDIIYMTVDDGDLYPLANQCEKVLAFMQRHKLYRVGIEVNGIGNALPEIMRNLATNQHLPINIVKISNHTRKETRILNALEPLLTTGRLFMHNRVKQTGLLSEMLAWTPVGSIEHDDGLDAVAGALSMTPVPVRPGSKTGNIIHAQTEFKI